MATRCTNPNCNNWRSCRGCSSQPASTHVLPRQQQPRQQQPSQQDKPGDFFTALLSGMMNFRLSPEEQKCFALTMQRVDLEEDQKKLREIASKAPADSEEALLFTQLIALRDRRVAELLQKERKCDPQL